MYAKQSNLHANVKNVNWNNQLVPSLHWRREIGPVFCKNCRHFLPLRPPRIGNVFEGHDGIVPRPSTV